MKRPHEKAWDNKNPDKFLDRFDEERQPLFTYIASRCHGDVVDLGGGKCKLYPYLDVNSYTILDLTKQFLAQCKANHPEITAVEGTILNTGFNDNQFNVSVVNAVAEHLKPEDLKRALGEATRVAQRTIVGTFLTPHDEPTVIYRDIPSYLVRYNLDVFTEALLQNGGKLSVTRIGRFTVYEVE